MPRFLELGLPVHAPAFLVLADGSLFAGESIGADGQAVGEVVFNTAMTGYQEILTDPSYAGQLVTLTYPHIGSVGANSEDNESAKAHAAGLIIRDLPLRPSNWRMQEDLPSFLRRQGVVALAGIDTRRLTRRLREKGAQNACLFVGEASPANLDLALAAARSAPSMAGLDLAKVVTCHAPYAWREGTWRLGQGHQPAPTPRWKVAAYDYGVKHNILRMLGARGCEVSVLPAQAPASDVFALKPDGVFLSNGPGDPEPCDYAIRSIGEIIEQGIPVFGICLGHQLLGLASGARTLKMKFGHHGGNHPVQDLDTGKVYITSQNHGFAVDEASLPSNLRATHRSLFDGSLQGIARTDRPAFSFQGHPEASPGPHEVSYLFDRFIALMQERSA